MADEKSSLPARQTLLDRQALERVLARAAELQGAGALPESSDLISESQLLDIGNEVGLNAATINQALAEERTRVNVPEERGLVAQIAGASFATATRTVPGTPRDVLATIDSWMLRDECLQVQRRFADRITWEPQRGLFGKLRRTVNVSGRGYYLMDAGQVSATVLPVDATRVVVRLDADIHASRAKRVGMGGVPGRHGSRGERNPRAWSHSRPPPTLHRRRRGDASVRRRLGSRLQARAHPSHCSVGCAARARAGARPARARRVRAAGRTTRGDIPATAAAETID